MSAVDALLHRSGHPAPGQQERAADSVATIYNQAGDDYVAYADGDPTRPFDFDGNRGDGVHSGDGDVRVR